MKKIELLIALIKSMSKSEKRYFKLYSNLQSGTKIYLFLFDLLEKMLPEEDIYEEFHKKYKDNNIEVAAKHLYTVILDCLQILREKQDIQSKIFSYISKANILFERELFEEAFVELDKAKKLASTYEQDTLLLLIRRTELKYFNTLDFKGMNEKQLVNKQMKINEIMKYSRNVNLHLQLYDILRHRLIYKGYSRSDKQREDLNDLVLSELNLISNNSYKSFESAKLHLLFQATYYLNSGNYKSALRDYEELIFLFEKNPHLMLNPPIYYLDALQGILESLHTAGLYNEMPFFIEKLEKLSKNEYTTEFKMEIQWLIYIYQLISLLNTGKFDEAYRLFTLHSGELYKKVSLLKLDSQIKLHLYTSILHLCRQDLTTSRQHIKKVFASGKLYASLPSFKIVRLFNLILQAELGNYEWLTNEISSIKRNIQFEKQTGNTEKLIFRFVLSYPLPSYQQAREKLWLHYQKEIAKIRANKYERQLLKTFDFLAWMESKLTKRPLEEVLQEKE